MLICLTILILFQLGDDGLAGDPQRLSGLALVIAVVSQGLQDEPSLQGGKLIFEGTLFSI